MSLTAIAQPAQLSGSHIGDAFMSSQKVEPAPNHSQIDHHAERKKLLSKLRGQTICMPDLRPFLAHWPKDCHPELERLRGDTREWLSRYESMSTRFYQSLTYAISVIPPGKALNALILADFALFAATWWPHTTYEKLKTVCFLFAWLFIRDDEVDNSDSAIVDDVSAAQIYHDQTTAYVRWTLGLDATKPTGITSPVILCFTPIGEALKNAYDMGQRQRFFEAIEFYMTMVKHEQKLRLSGHIPTIEDFWYFRLGSSGVDLALNVHEYSCEGVRFPDEFWADEDVKKLFRFTNTNLSTVNDLLSVKKEIKDGGLDSLIPIYLYHIGDLTKATNDAVAYLTGEIKGQDETSASLIRRYESADEKTRQQVKEFVEACKYYCTGNLTWSLSTGRYGVEIVGNEIVIQL